MHPGHLRLGFKPAGQLMGCGRLRRHADTQGFKPLENYPRIERRNAWPSGTQELEHLIHQGLAATYRTTQHPPLTIQVLGSRVDHQISPQLEGLLQGRRAEAVVDRQQHARLMGNGGHCRNIHQLSERIGRRLDKEQTRFRRHRSAVGIQVGGRHEGGFNTEARQNVAEELLRGTEQATGRHDVITGTEQGHHGGHDRRHPGCRRHAGLGPFQGRQALLHRSHGRIGEAGVNVPLFLPGETRGRLGCAIEDEAGSEI